MPIATRSRPFTISKKMINIVTNQSNGVVFFKFQQSSQQSPFNYETIVIQPLFGNIFLTSGDGLQWGFKNNSPQMKFWNKQMENLFKKKNYNSQIKFISHLIQCEQRRKYMMWNIPWQAASTKNFFFLENGLPTLHLVCWTQFTKPFMH